MLVPGSSPFWQLACVLQDGLQFNQPRKLPEYPVPTFTTGLRNLTGRRKGDGAVTIYAIAAQTSTISGGEPDPAKLVAVIDLIDAFQLPVNHRPDYGQSSDDQGTLERFVPLQQTRSGAVFRGVAFAPPVTHYSSSQTSSKRQPL